MLDALNLLTLCHSVSEILLVLGFRDWDLIFYEFRRPGLVLLWVSYKLVQNSVGHPTICWPCATLYHRLSWYGFQSSWFRNLWVHESRPCPFMSFREANAKQCWTPSICWPCATRDQILSWFWDWDLRSFFYEFMSPDKILLWIS